MIELTEKAYKFMRFLEDGDGELSSEFTAINSSDPNHCYRFHHYSWREIAFYVVNYGLVTNIGSLRYKVYRLNNSGRNVMRKYEQEHGLIKDSPIKHRWKIQSGGDK